MTAEVRKKEVWHFDKGVPLSMIGIFILQGAGAVWWVSDLSKEVQESKHRIEVIEAQRVSERLTALESQMIDSRGSLLRIESKLDRVIERSQK